VGIDARTEPAADADPFDALVDAAAGYDAVVASEQAPSLLSLLFGEAADRVAAETVGPVVVVRRNESNDDE
jgi:nucleotide-binding universal stress UspA family protein